MPDASNRQRTRKAPRRSHAISSRAQTGKSLLSRLPTGSGRIQLTSLEPANGERIPPMPSSRRYSGPTLLLGIEQPGASPAERAHLRDLSSDASPSNRLSDPARRRKLLWRRCISARVLASPPRSRHFSRTRARNLHRREYCVACALTGAGRWRRPAGRAGPPARNTRPAQARSGRKAHVVFSGEGSTAVGRCG